MARRKAASRAPRKVKDLSARKGPKGGARSAGTGPAPGPGVPPLSGLLGGGVPGIRRPGDQ